ncbi:Nudix hydrolase 9 [Platanthera zijinensis]|uniref:Nudix hydrolase 9 n=1 Tax=Platanthera zijinensis TaxID=2320716 RepID=A0AAP0GEY2_9ASPA
MTATGMSESAALMDQGSAFTLLLSCPDGIPSSRVHVDFSASYDRIPHPDVNLEDSVNEIWTCRTEKNQSLYNGQKFRPEEIGISTHQTKKNSTDHEALIDKISQEMFNGIIREVVEEIGVPAESLNDPLFIGISRRDLNVRPAAFFFVSCNLKSQEIQQLYSGAQDGYESTRLYAVSTDELLKMSETMPGCHRGGYALYELMTEAKNARVNASTANFYC